MPAPALTAEEFARRMAVALRSGRVRVLPDPGVNDEQLVRKVESLIQASEAKQQRALNDWLVRLNAELPAMRQADLYRFIRDVEIQNRPGIMTVPVASLRK
jgi:hypothetical protein